MGHRRSSGPARMRLGVLASLLCACACFCASALEHGSEVALLDDSAPTKSLLEAQTEADTRAQQAKADLDYVVSELVGNGAAASDVAKAEDPQAEDVVAAAQKVKDEATAKPQDTSKESKTEEISQAAEKAKNAVREWKQDQKDAEKQAMEKEHKEDMKLNEARKKAHEEVRRAKRHAAALEAKVLTREKHYKARAEKMMLKTAQTKTVAKSFEEADSARPRSHKQLLSLSM